MPTPDEADLALIRIGAPYDPRDDLFLESYFHQGSLEFRPGLIYRLRSIAARVPLVVDIALDRAAVVTPIAGLATALTVTFGVSDEVLLRALAGDILPEGRLPIPLPESMDAVRSATADRGLPESGVLYPVGTGLTLPV